MERSPESRHERPPERGSSKLTREKLLLAESAAETGVKVLPGKEWSLHHSVAETTRRETLQGLLDGRLHAEDVADSLAPDALLYNAEDIETEGIEAVTARVRDTSAFVAHYDHARFARFVESMSGRDVALEDIERLYDGLAHARIQKKMMDAYGATGRQQIERVLRSEAKTAAAEIAALPRSQKVLRTLKADWLCDDLGLLAPEERDRLTAQLSGDERKLFEETRSSYRAYIQSGDETGYVGLAESMREGLPTIQRAVGGEKPSDAMQTLQKELEPFMEQVGMPGTPEDPAIPPDDADEYHTPPAAAGAETAEKRRSRPIFEIEPPLGGYYASGRKSYFDIDTKTWSKKKRIVPYTEVPNVPERHTISGTLDVGLKSLPIPNGFCLDAASLRSTGTPPEIFRDQNGCFYLEAKGPGTFSADFLKESTPFVNAPIPEDTDVIHRGALSHKTEAAFLRFRGTAQQKAEQVRQYLLSNHFYPGGGDVQQAQALQYKLRSESTGDMYVQNLDASEYLECYSANTLFIAVMRKLGVPCRLVVGHKVEGAKKGKSAITESTGHAWSEFWDGSAWRRFDATPQPKPEDKKDDDEKEKEKTEPTEEADDDGIDSSEDSGGEGSGAPQQGEQAAPSDSPTDAMTEATQSEVSEAENELQEARQEVARQEAKQKELQQQIEAAKTFDALQDLKKQAEESELFDDIRDDLEERLDAKEEQMKEALHEQLETMAEDGFLDDRRRDELESAIDERSLEELGRFQAELERENALYNEYQDIKEEVMPLVDQWFRYFAERLPRQDEVEFDEDSLTRQGAFDRRSVMRTRNLLFGTVKNPRQIKPSIKPRFLASVLVDVSGSMEQGNKLKNARKLLVFYSELFSRISEAFGYIRFSIDIFSDSVTAIKTFEHEYDSSQRYAFDDGTPSTVKVRMMQKLVTQGGTNMLSGIQHAAERLNKEAEGYPDYASAFYFVGDGGDTCGNAPNIRDFLRTNKDERGFGDHMYSATLLGNDAQRHELAAIFGDDHTTVAPTFDNLIEQSMESFETDIEDYLQNKTV